MDIEQGRLIESRMGFPEAIRGLPRPCGNCAVAQMRGCSGETICTVVYDYDENYVCAGINAASQEVLSTCKPFGVIA